ncbi:MAG TPA: PaaI family thioesterase [Anaerovoracaceae bacterium]|nr:PaaI family thioesterase [Anaerovoracaceae bacterium]
MNKEQWAKGMQDILNNYLNQNYVGFDKELKVELDEYNYGEQSAVFIFKTQDWQVNERGFIHGGIIAAMLDTGLGTLAWFLAEGKEVVTTDLNISYIRPLKLGDTGAVKVYVVKNGRSLIRIRGELFSKNTGKALASASGAWMPINE